MKVTAQLVSKKKDNKTLCRPSEGYNDNAEIERDHYEEKAVSTVIGELPPNDEIWPKGAPMEGYVKVKNEILKKKPCSGDTSD